MGTNGLKDIKADITDIPLNPGLITEFLVLVSTEVESLNSAEQLMGFDLGSIVLLTKNGINILVQNSTILVAIP